MDSISWRTINSRELLVPLISSGGVFGFQDESNVLRILKMRKLFDDNPAFKGIDSDITFRASNSEDVETFFERFERVVSSATPDSHYSILCWPYNLYAYSSIPHS